MPLNWRREPWRKLYIREEGSFAGLPLLVRALAGELIKFGDDNGRIPLGGQDPASVICRRGGAEMGERRMVRRYVQVLLDDGYLVVEGDALRIRNFKPAQTRFDRVRGEHDLVEERGHGSAEAASVVHDSSVSGAPPVHDSSVNGAPVEREPGSKNELTADDSSIHPVASRSDPKRSETKPIGGASPPAVMKVGHGTQLDPAPDPNAYLLADLLRDVVLGAKPNHRIGEPGVWTTERREWARSMAKTLRRRPRPAIELAIKHIANQTGPYPFVVESAQALDEKLDRIEMAMKKAADSTASNEAAPRRLSNPYQPLRKETA